MNFTCQSLYRQKELTALSRAMRKTARRKSDRNIQVLEWGSIALGIAVVLTTNGTVRAMLFLVALCVAGGMAGMIFLNHNNNNNNGSGKKSSSPSA